MKVRRAGRRMPMGKEGAASLLLQRWDVGLFFCREYVASTMANWLYVKVQLQLSTYKNLFPALLGLTSPQTGLSACCTRAAVGVAI